MNDSPSRMSAHKIKAESSGLIKENVARIQSCGAHKTLTLLNKGVEKESLRIDSDGVLAQTPHPKALGATLTHPSITTDFSEALLEFITPVHNSAAAIIDHLCDLHTYVYQNIGDEKLWVNSMPCVLEGDDYIPLARYGNSNIGQMKTVYRRGLGHRYGRLMQTISGIHYNFSLPDAFWQHWCNDASSEQAIQSEKSKLYLAGVRNVHRYSWLIFFLFGASPAVCKTFLRGREHTLASIDSHSFYTPFATTLRMSSVGYSNDAQSNIRISFDSVEEYANSLYRATETSHPDYEAIGVKENGEYRQLNSNLLQIENEYYAVVRPKQPINSGEKPSCALLDRGIEYLELRAIDLDPYSPVGMNKEQLDFLDLFSLFCIFADSPSITHSEQVSIRENKSLTAVNGRDRNLKLNNNGDEIRLRQWATQLCDEMDAFAEILDTQQGGTRYKNTMESQRAKLTGEAQTPAARIIQDMSDKSESFYSFAMGKAIEHEQYFKSRTLEPHIVQNLKQQATQSLQQQQEIEANDTLSFDEFLVQYFNQ